MVWLAGVEQVNHHFCGVSMLRNHIRVEVLKLMGQKLKI